MSSPPPACTLTILLPVRNEGINLRIMLKMLGAIVEVPYEVLIVHDTVDDDSLKVVAGLSAGQAVRTLHNTLGRGVVNAIRAGVAAAEGQYVLVFAADEVGPVLAIEDMLALMDHGCEFVSCTRYAHGGRRLGGSVIGGMMSRTANRWFHWLAGSVLTDCTTGIKMFRRDQFERLHLESRPIGWAVAFEMAIKAQTLGLTLGEVPIISIDRLYGGKSTFRLGPWTGEYFRWFVWGVRHLRRERRPGTAVRVRIPTATALGGKASG
jgi:glycosyltransferase involved in cell wall biosynthesis